MAESAEEKALVRFEALQRIAEELNDGDQPTAADLMELVTALQEVDALEHIQVRLGDRIITVSVKGAPPFRGGDLAERITRAVEVLDKVIPNTFGTDQAYLVTAKDLLLHG